MLLRALIVIALLVLTFSVRPLERDTYPVVYGPGKGDSRDVWKVAELPDLPVFKVDGSYMDLGLRYNNVTLLGLPLLEFDRSYVGYVPGDSRRSYSLSEEQLRAITEVAHIKLRPAAELDPGYTPAQRAAGLIIAISILGGAAMAYLGRGHGRDDG